MIKNALVAALASVWPMVTIFCVIIITIRIAYLKINKRDLIFHQEIMSLFFILYILLLFELLTGTENSMYGQNLVPFTEIFRYDFKSELFYYNVIGNILVFLPFGYFVSNYISAKKIATIFLITTIASLTIELVQSKIGRAFDIDDVILNVTGAIIGFFIHKLLTTIKKKLPGFLQKDYLYDILALAFVLFVIYYFYKFIGLGWLT